MLVKLIKNEWKRTRYIPFIMICAVLGMTFIQCILYQLMSSGSFIIVYMANSSLNIYILSLFGLFFGIAVYFSIRFYRNLYTDEGYLMHTLPASSVQLILSKGIVFFIWIIISEIIFFLSVFFLVISHSEIGLTVFLNDLPELVSDIEMVFDMPFALFLIWGVLFSLSAAALSVFMVYGSISLGRLIKNHPLLGSVLVYILVIIVLQILFSSLVIILSHFPDSSISSFLFMWVLVIGAAALAAGFFFFSKFVMDKKLNL